ncbi:MAG: hypothetical protein JEZ11_07440 [Desulfobacterales bacterium]|nr:hypothetical protein [Desulfobacterales bacterium]
MKNIDESALKAELDKITQNIDDIMKRVEAAVPAPSPPPEDLPDAEEPEDR